MGYFVVIVLLGFTIGTLIAAYRNNEMPNLRARINHKTQYRGVIEYREGLYWWKIEYREWREYVRLDLTRRGHYSGWVESEDPQDHDPIGYSTQNVAEFVAKKRLRVLRKNTLSPETNTKWYVS